VTYILGALCIYIWLCLHGFEDNYLQLENNIMKNLLLFAVAASFIQPTLADKLTTKRCICASEHYIGYVSEWTVYARSMGLLNDSNTFRRYETFNRDDNIFDQRAGYKCKPGGNITSENCVRIPDIFQYVSDW